MNKRAFTLVEILVAVLIVTILVIMAMPLYEKTIERSRLAEARTLMNRLQEAKWAAMDNMGCDEYSATDTNCPQLQHLGVSFADETGVNTGREFASKYFTYSLLPTPATCANGIAATRKDGDNSGTTFVYYGLRRDGKSVVFACISGNCEAYGMEQKSSLSCE